MGEITFMGVPIPWDDDTKITRYEEVAPGLLWPVEEKGEADAEADESQSRPEEEV